MYNLLGRFVARTATPADLKLLEELCDVVKHTSLCGLGQSAPNPLMSTLRYFRSEYEVALGASQTAETGLLNHEECLVKGGR